MTCASICRAHDGVHEAVSWERMNGREPSTFCMASRADRSDPQRPTATNPVNRTGLSRF